MLRFSVITICYNSAATLRRSVESVLTQTLRPAEYIFVDGGSTDGTWELLQETSAQLNAAGIAVKCLRQVRNDGEAGIPSAWNQGIVVATGDVIALLNSDDVYLPAALEQVNACFEATPSAQAVACPIEWVDGNGQRQGVFYPSCLCTLPWKMPLPHPGLFVKRGCYESLGVYDTRYALSADYDFVWRLKKAGVLLAYAAAVSTQMTVGGRANSQRALARRETLAIARSYHWEPLLPWLAFLLRTITGR